MQDMVCAHIRAYSSDYSTLNMTVYGQHGADRRLWLEARPPRGLVFYLSSSYLRVSSAAQQSLGSRSVRLATAKPRQ
jgi:hypothetical protein